MGRPASKQTPPHLLPFGPVDKKLSRPFGKTGSFGANPDWASSDWSGDRRGNTAPLGRGGVSSLPITDSTTGVNQRGVSGAQNAASFSIHKRGHDWFVLSQSSGGTYRLRPSDSHPTCSCLDR